MLSDRGRLRHGNEDACGARRELGAVVVCDGMGGAAGGEVASTLAVETFLRNLGDGRGGNGRGGSGRTANSQGTHPRDRVEKAVCAANHAVYQRAQRTRALRGMGTTLVGVMVEDVAATGRPTVWLAHVGDSRCYRLRAGTLELLTEDHSLVEEQVRAGVLSRVQASVSPIRNIITRAIGAQAKVEPAIERLATEPGDIYLLASDGLTRELEDGEIAAVLTTSLVMKKTGGMKEAGRENIAQSLLEATCQALVDAANAHGGGDNITVALVWVA